jgi:hypothetical protein
MTGLVRKFGTHGVDRVGAPFAVPGGLAAVGRTLICLHI